MTIALTPEELEILLEDALLLGDRSAVARLFAEEALLDEGGRFALRRGGDVIADHVVNNWTGACAYVAAPYRVLQGHCPGGEPGGSKRRPPRGGEAPGNS